MKKLLLVMIVLMSSSLTFAQKHIYNVLNSDDSRFVQDKFDFITPIEELPFITYSNSPNTRGVYLPWAFKGELYSVDGIANAHTVTKALSLKQKELIPITVKGNALVNLSFINYTDSNSGPYTEFIISYYVSKSDSPVEDFSSSTEFLIKSKLPSYKSKILLYTDHLTLGMKKLENFKSTEIAISAGRVAIAFPKFFGNVSMDRSNGLALKVIQPEVKYFKSNAKDAPKAGSINLSIQVGNKVKENYIYRNTLGRFALPLETNYIVEDNKGSLCHVLSRVRVKAIPLRLNGEKIKFSLSGTSESVKSLKASEFLPLNITHIKEIAGFLAPDKNVDNNACLLGSGRSYDWDSFYPSWIIKN